jgi:uncharacterized phage-associated protein
MQYSALAIANYFLDLAYRDGETITAMKIQKLVYYAHGWSLAATGQPLIDEAIEAWTYGPVIPSLYHEFKRFGSGPITGKATTVELISPSSRSLRLVTPVVCDAETMELLDTVWEAYGDFSGIQLSNLTHQPGSPWSVVYEKNAGRKGVDIPDDLIKDHFVAAAS